MIVTSTILLQHHTDQEVFIHCNHLVAGTAPGAEGTFLQVQFAKIWTSFYIDQVLSCLGFELLITRHKKDLVPHWFPSHLHSSIVFVPKQFTYLWLHPLQMKNCITDRIRKKKKETDWTCRKVGMTLQQVFSSQEPDTPWHLHSFFMFFWIT